MQSGTVESVRGNDTPATNIPPLVHFSPTPECCSTPQLDSNDMDTLMSILKRDFPGIAGLQPSVLGSNILGSSVPLFKPEVERFVQLINVGDHWICATNMFTASLHEIFVYDSQHHGNINKQAQVQVRC